MSEYFSTKKINLSMDELIDSNIEDLYNSGFVFTRLGKGVMQQTRSLRLNLVDFKLSSENKRILKKNNGLKLTSKQLPYENYTWEIHKLGKQYYEKKFGDSIMSASKIKEMFTDSSESNMNFCFEYSLGASSSIIGYCLTHKTDQIIHYAYPFYDLAVDTPNLGMGMMLNAILWAKEQGLSYIYLGSVVDQKSKYKLQFNSLEWYDTDSGIWSKDLGILKSVLT